MTSSPLADKPRRGRKPRFNDRRTEVLRAAARVFSEHGYRQATLDDIAGALDMTRQALYYYADSKEELLKACADIAHEQLSKARRDAVAEKTGLARLQAYFRAHLAVGCDDFGRCLLMNEPRDTTEAHRAWLNTELKKRNKAIEAMILTGIDDRSIAPCDAVNVRRVLFATFNAAPRWVHARGERAIAAEADRLFAIVAKGLAPA